MTVDRSMLRELDEHSICFITNVNNELEYGGAKAAIQELAVPADYQVEMIGVRHAKSMTDGYQKAMESSKAKYKIYLHQDVFVINKNIISSLLSIFQADPHVGMIGLAGTANLPHERPIWWKSSLPSLFGTCYTVLSDNQIVRNYYGEVLSRDLDFYVNAAAVDGLFMATQYDLPWRTDLFCGWHFYDISQSREFINAGYKVVIPYQHEPWVIHDCRKGSSLDAAYYENMDIFKENYSW